MMVIVIVIIASTGTASTRGTTRNMYTGVIDPDPNPHLQGVSGIPGVWL